MKKLIKPNFITIINDSKDGNAKARQETRWASLFPSVNISFIGVSSDFQDETTLEAAGNLVDILDAGGGKPGVIAVNVAPRGEVEVDGPNGSPFAYFWYMKTLVISTIKGYNLSLVKKLGLTSDINLLDTSKVVQVAENTGLITNKLRLLIEKTQFRSLEFQPRVAKWITDGHDVPFDKYDINLIPDAPDSIWCIDSFGNLKTTLTKKDIQLIQNGKSYIDSNLGKLPYYDRLKDVPDGQLAIYSGSSGINGQKFLEIAKQNEPGSAQKEYKQKIGSELNVV